jgi:hypothetical protein
MPPSTKHPPWRLSNGKKLLINDLQTGVIPLSGSALSTREIFSMRPEFGYDDPLNVAKFASRLRSARTQVLNDRCRAASDKALLEHDRTIHPKQPMNYRGEPEWDGSEAQEQLRKDMDEGKHTTMKPLLLYSSHEEYKKFPLAVFRKHIYQETNRRKFLAQHNAQKRQRHEN